MTDFDYLERLLSDLAEQFREKPNVQALIAVIAKQLQDVYKFFVDLFGNRYIDTASGVQLDYLGSAVGITREEAAEMAARAGETFETEDDMYRAYIRYRISLNSSDCSYSDVMDSVRAQWSGEAEYSENPSNPATVILTLQRFQNQNISTLLNSPIAKPAGVGIRFRAKADVGTTVYIGVSMVQRRSLTFIVD